MVDPYLLFVFMVRYFIEEHGKTLPVPYGTHGT
jgi:hypothetical protein